MVRAWRSKQDEREVGKCIGSRKKKMIWTWKHWGSFWSPSCFLPTNVSVIVNFSLLFPLCCCFSNLSPGPVIRITSMTYSHRLSFSVNRCTRYNLGVIFTCLGGRWVLFTVLQRTTHSPTTKAVYFLTFQVLLKT